MSTLNDLDIATPLVGSTIDELAAEVRNLKTILKNVLLVAHAEDGSIEGSAIDTLAAETVGTAELADDAVTSDKILNDAVITAKILNANVTGAKIAAGALTSTHFSAACLPQTAFQPASIPMTCLQGLVTSGMFTAGSVGTTALANAGVTNDKIVSMAFSKLTGTATDNQVLTYTTALGWHAADAPELPTIALATFGEESASSGGDAATADSWYKRLITEHLDASNILSISSSEITLIEGSYFFYARCPAHEVGSHQTRLIRKTVSGGATSTLAVGSGAHASVPAGGHAQTDSILFCAIDNPDDTTYVYYIEHYFELAADSDEFGENISTLSGSNCMHTSGFIFKLP